MNQIFKSTFLALAGGAVGAAVVYLTAPASGSETRRRLARRIDDERNELLKKGQRAVGKAADYLEQQVKQGKRMLSEAVAR